MRLQAGVVADADVSTDGLYRYSLTRDWHRSLTSEDTGRVLWIMLNPSTADADEDDPTLRRCQAFTRRWGHTGCTVVNLFAYRATDPKELARLGIIRGDPVGPRGDLTLRHALLNHRGLTIAAWGANPLAPRRGEYVRKLSAELGRPLHHLGLTKAGFPRHPLYVHGNTAPTEWPAP